MSMQFDLYLNKSAFDKLSGLTRLEYAVIHSTYEPSQSDIDGAYQRDKMKNPHNEPNKPPIRSRVEIIADLKIGAAKILLKRIYKNSNV